MQDGAGRRVRILVVGDILAAIEGLVHQRRHLLSQPGHGAVVVRNVNGRPGTPPDFQRLAEGIQQPVAQGVAGVGAVKAALLGGHAGDGGQLVGVAVGAGGVGEAGGESESAVAHPLAGQLPHRVQLGGGGQPGRPAHGGHPDGGVRHEVQDIAGGVAVKQGQKIGHAAPAGVGRRAVDGRQIGQQLFQAPGRGGGVGQAVHPQRFGGDALPDFRFVGRLGEQLQVGMGVHINEAGADDIPAGVHGAGGGHAGHIAGDDPQAVAGHGHAAPVAGRASAVHNRSVGKQQVNHSVTLSPPAWPPGPAGPTGLADSGDARTSYTGRNRAKSPRRHRDGNSTAQRQTPIRPLATVSC